MTPVGGVPFDGAVLTGGGSTRIGEDKSLLVVRGRAMAAIVATAVRDAGADGVVAVGGDAPRLDALGVFDRVLADAHPGEGPLGGLLSAVAASTAPVVVVLACDTPELTAETPRALVTALVDADADVAVGTVDGREQPLTAAWRRESVAPIARSLFLAGERAPRTLLRLLRCARVELPPDAVRDVDRPEDLARYAPERSDAGPPDHRPSADRREP